MYHKLQNITILTRGSRGDFQPYLAIAIALKNQGYNVRMISNSNYKSITESFGIAFVGAGIGYDNAIQNDKSFRAAMVKGDTMTLIKAVGSINKQDVSQVSKAILQDLQDHHPDLIILGSMLQYFACYAAHKMKIPFINISLYLIEHSTKRAMFGLPNLPFGLHRYILNLILFIYLNDLKIYDKTLNENVMNQSTPIRFLTSKMPQVNLTSPTLASILFHPNDIGDHVKLIGLPVVPKENQLASQDGFGNIQEKKEIENFLAKGDCIYIGWGSMVSGTPLAMVEFAVRSAKMSNQRAIILGGFAEISMETLENALLHPSSSSKDNTSRGGGTIAVDGESLVKYAHENVLFVNKAPHEWLFPKVKVIVHHGGAGTTNAALRSGRPMIITPVFWDQWDFVCIPNELGIGFGFEKQQLQQITWQELGDAIQKVVSDDDMAKRANEIGKVIRNEGTAETVVGTVEWYWKDVVQTGEFFDKHFPGSDPPIYTLIKSILVFLSTIMVVVVVVLLAIAMR